jgi:hypothetical protein
MREWLSDLHQEFQHEASLNMLQRAARMFDNAEFSNGD